MKLYTLKNIFNVEKWDLGKKCAYSSSFDDGLECCIYDITKYANNLGIPLTLYINPCSNPKYNTEYYKDYNKFTQNDKKKLKQLSNLGNEIASHTINHASLVHCPGIDFDEEIIKSKKIITDITNNHDITFCYPYGHIPENETVLNKIKSNYLGARAFNTGFNYNKFNFYKLNNIDIGGKNNNQLNNYVKEAIKTNDWLIFSGHGIDNYGWNPINSSELYNHYNFINDNKNGIYIDTIANIIKYIKQRESLKYEILETPKYYKITIKIPNFNFQLIPLTFSSNLCSIYQNNKKLNTINKKNKLYFKTKDFSNPIIIYK